jgi:UDP-2,3-diacylglucosamine pyrophosphatase LpxH
MASRVLLATVALALMTGGARVDTQPLRSVAARSIIVISDLHMGEGLAAREQWVPFEDFRWAPEFAEFLQAVSRDGNNAVDLVLNGDTFELSRSTYDDCGAAGTDAGCTESGAAARLDRVLKAHAREIEALGVFARTGSNRIVFVPGDQDAALLFRELQRRLHSAIAAPRDRVTIASSGYWLSSDGQVFAEHGHQIGFSAYRFEQWPAPFLKRSGPPQLVRTWGEALAAELESTFERRFPIIDNVAALGTGFKYAAALGPDVAGRLLPQLLRYELFLMSWQQFRMELDDGDVVPPTWDVAQARTQTQDGSFVAASVPDDDPLKPLVAQAIVSGALKAMALTDDELVAICDYRAAVRRARRRFEPTLTQLAPRGPVVAECPRTPDSRGAAFEYFWRSRDLMFARHLEAIGRRLAPPAHPSVFVHGHTHLADRAQSTANMISGGLLRIPMEGFSPQRGALTPVVINGGAWQRTITPVQLGLLAADSGRTVSDVLASVKPEDLAPCYSFVQISVNAGVAAPTVRYWRANPAARWGFGATCAE